jgi:hypothetical protein
MGLKCIEFNLVMFLARVDKKLVVHVSLFVVEYASV